MIRTRGAAAFAVLSVLLACTNVHAQQPFRTLSGIVVAGDDGAAVAGARIHIPDTDVGTLSGDDGAFHLRGVPSGDVRIVVEHIAWRTDTVLVAGDNAAPVEIRLVRQLLPLDQVVVSASREEQRRSETAATVNVISSADIARVRPTHPSELMNRVPGVWVNVTGGEGHMTAIRQPKTTNPVYLFLENGVPTRSTGFFNHNALYETNMPQADRIEVLKGPATALYGSDAIGGIVNVMTRAPADAPALQVTAEGGSFGFARVLGAASHHTRSGGVLTELNFTRTDGWREGTGYDRQSGTLRFDHRLSPLTTTRSMATFSHIDQQTAGSSAISRSDYEARPELNYTPISYRKVQAFRASTALDHISGSTLFSVTPFVRWNSMEMLPNWSLTYDPAISETGHGSVGALLKVRRDLGALRARAIAGLDLDYSPGTHREWRVAPVRKDGIFTSYTRGDVIYDYDVQFASASPYLQLEASPLERLRVVGGLRYDQAAYDYENPLGELQAGQHRRPASTNVSYSHLSPKLGVVLAATDELNVFAAYGHGFRIPSEGQLFRQGRAQSSLTLAPVKADNYELGANVRLFDRVRLELAAYHMRKHDDLLSFVHTDGSTETMNAGETLHQGVEVGASVALPAELRLDVAWSHARHTYEEWVTGTGADLSGNEMEDAPRNTGSASLGWTPRRWSGLHAALEAQRVGSYWMDAENTQRYDGHTLLSVRAELPLVHDVALFARVSNLLDERYAENAAYTSARGAEFAPGMPRAVYIGLRYR